MKTKTPILTEAQKAVVLGDPIPVPMTTQAYLFSISRTTDADVLHGLRTEIATDDSLLSTEKYELYKAINLRFSQLNFAAAGPQRERKL